MITLTAERLEKNHWLELVNESAIDPEIARLNFKSLYAAQPYDYLLYSQSIPRRNDGRVSDWVLQKYQNVENGGWWVSGIDLLTFEDSLWGQFKPDSPRKDDGGKIIKYEAAFKTATEIFALKIPAATWQLIARRYDVALPENYKSLPHSAFWQWVLNHPQIPVILGEGAKKAASVLSCGYVMISLPGVFNGVRQPQDEFGGKIGSPSLIPQLQVFAQPGRRIYLCFDQDSKRKTIRNVNQAIVKTAKTFTSHGCEVKIIMWNPVFGKGVDDVIAAHGREQFDEFYRNAHDFDKWQTLQLKRLTYQRDLVLNQRYLGEFAPPPDKQLICSKAAKGTGKTHWYQYITNPVIRSGEKKVLIITHRVQLGIQIAQRLGIPFIAEIKDCEQGSHFGMGLCIDSLHPKSQAKFNPEEWKGAWVIFDEIMQLIWHLLNSRTCQNERVSIIKTLKQLLLNVVNFGGKIFIADADLNDIAIDFIKGLIGRDVETWIVENEYKFEQGWNVYQFNGGTPAQMVKYLENKLNQGEKHFVCLSGQKAKSKWGSRNLEAFFRKKIPDLRILRIDSETVSDPNHIAFGCVEKLNEIITEYDLILATPTIETGVSIDTPHFDGVWGIFQGVQTADSVRQFLSRYRIPVPRYVWLKSIGINRIGNGNTTVNGLLSSEFKKDKLNVTKLINSGFEESFDNNFEPICLNTWAKMGCIINLGMINYAKTIIDDLKEEGHTIVDILGEELVLPTTKESDAFKEEISATCQEQYQAYCEAIANVESPSDEKLEKLSRQQSKTEQERLESKKGELEKTYKIPVSPELVARHDKNWYSQIRLDYYFGEGRDYLSERDKNVMSNLLNNGGGHYFMPDVNDKMLGSRVAALDFLKYGQLLELEEVCNSHPLAQEFFATCKQHSYNLKLLLGLDFTKDKTPIIALQRLHGALGFKLPCLRREGSRGSQERIYGKPAPEFLRQENSKKPLLDADGKAVPVFDDRKQVFVEWLARDRAAAEKAASQKAAASRQPIVEPEAIATTAIKSPVELAIEHLEAVKDWSEMQLSEENLSAAWQILSLDQQKRLEQLHQQWQQKFGTESTLSEVDREIKTADPFCSLESLSAETLWMRRLGRARSLSAEIARSIYQMIPTSMLNQVWEKLTTGTQDYYTNLFNII